MSIYDQDPDTGLPRSYRAFQNPPDEADAITEQARREMIETGQPAADLAADTGQKWTTEQLKRDFALRETRHSFVSVLSDQGVSIEAIADAVGHINSKVTKAVYRHQIADTVAAAATAWDQIMPSEQTA